MKVTTVFKKNIIAYNQGARVIANQGGTRSSKTWSLLQLLYLIAINSNRKLVISIVSESLPHLKRGAIRDFMDMLQNENLYNEKGHNKTDNVFKVGNSIIEFFSADNPGKVRGPARDILLLNEANHIQFETYRQLAVRTRKTVFLDWNPSAEFWYEEQGIKDRDGTVHIHSTYKDNEFLSIEQVKEIESNKHNADWWNVFGLGLQGSKEGLIYPDFTQVDNMPDPYKKRFCGLDFGFTNDPTAIVDVRVSGGELWLDELCYDKGMTNPDISARMKHEGIVSVPTVCDSAEMKSIQELKNLGCKVEPAIKGPGSILSGIEILHRYKLNVTKRSLNLIKELRNYKWEVDPQTGKPTNEPVDNFNHLMDAVRYVAINKLGSRKPRRKTTSKVGTYC